MIRNRLYSALQKKATPTWIFVWFLASHAVLLAMMTFTFPAIEQQIGAVPFDLRPMGYSVDDARQIVDHLDDETTALYLFPQLLLLDLLYPPFLALFLGSLLLRLGTLIRWSPKRIAIVVALPFMTMVFDYTENIFVIALITETSTVAPKMVTASSTFTILKGVTTSVAWGLILVQFVRWIQIKFQTKAKLANPFNNMAQVSSRA